MVPTHALIFSPVGQLLTDGQSTEAIALGRESTPRKEIGRMVTPTAETTPQPTQEVAHSTTLQPLYFANE